MSTISVINQSCKSMGAACYILSRLPMKGDYILNSIASKEDKFIASFTCEGKVRTFSFELNGNKVIRGQELAPQEAKPKRIRKGK